MVRRFALVLIFAAFAAHASEANEEQESEGNPEMTEEMMEEQTRADFESMDTNKDGKITREEIEAYLNDPEMNGEIDKFFGSADADKDGVITMEEYKLFVKHLLEQYESQGAYGGEEDLGEPAGGNNWFDDDELAELDEEEEL